MRYHYEKPILYFSQSGKTYECNHPVYDRCTLYLMNQLGLAVIQQRFDNTTKKSWWGEIDSWLVDELYFRKGFIEYFNKFADYSNCGLYPTVSVRQIMWALKMKPLKKEPWETSFDHVPI